MRDYAFYEASEQAPRRLGWLVRPFRRLLRRLLGPVWQREHELFVSLGTELDRVQQRQTDLHTTGEARLAELEQRNAAALGHLSDRLDALERQVQAAIALGWDHDALVRRLTAIEERLNELHDGRASATHAGTPAP